MSSASTQNSLIPPLRDPLPFRPPPPTPPDHLRNFRNNDIPRWLFRVYTPNSCGETTATRVRPKSTTTSAPDSAYVDIFDSSRPEALRAGHLRRHLQWECDKPKVRDCNFVSWSCSLLWVLQYALHRMEVYDGLQETREKVKFLLLDTSKLNPGTFISDVDLINFFAKHEQFSGMRSLQGLRNLRGQRKGYYFGEYLSQGDLQIGSACVQTDLQELIHCGLFELLPELNDQRQWRNVNKGGVFDLRETLRLSLVGNDLDNGVFENMATREDVLTAIELGRLFRSDTLDFTVPAAAVFLGLRKRVKQDPTILKVFAEKFSAAQIDGLQLGDIMIRIPGEPWIPEVLQFRMILRDIQQHFETLGEQRQQAEPREDSADVVIDMLSGLQISSVSA
ncbi:hypothetical protein QBC40DRAFT_290939 [Triangularia verruculosa]|uniref:DUF7587 domain-containing protein n=1 Tax=Triangularia verruculosa TaxID=2587418 RepID=A0AAN7AP69_9PEZI|nr:hypothetical protein QBC40DRAFT_290939 [Triangularia verruculosa]